jgi:hypothetical protein
MSSFDGTVVSTVTEYVDPSMSRLTDDSHNQTLRAQQIADRLGSSRLTDDSHNHTLRAQQIAERLGNASPTSTLLSERVNNASPTSTLQSERVNTASPTSSHSSSTQLRKSTVLRSVFVQDIGWASQVG